MRTVEVFSMNGEFFVSRMSCEKNSAPNNEWGWLDRISLTGKNQWQSRFIEWVNELSFQSVHKPIWVSSINRWACETGTNRMNLNEWAFLLENLNYFAFGEQTKIVLFNWHHYNFDSKHFVNEIDSNKKQSKTKFIPTSNRTFIVLNRFHLKLLTNWLSILCIQINSNAISNACKARSSPINTHGRTIARHAKQSGSIIQRPN